MTVIATGYVVGVNEGINANHRGTGELSVRAFDVTSASSDGILAETNDIAEGLSVIATGTIRAQNIGIDADHQGSGILFERRSQGLLFSADIEFDSSTSDLFLVTTLTSASDLQGLNPNQVAPGDVLTGLFGEPGLAPGLRETIFDIASLGNIDDLGFVFDELGPDGLTPGARVLMQTQDRFGDIVLAQAAGPRERRAWAVLDAFAIEQDGNGNSADFDGDSRIHAVGVSNVALGRFEVSAALGYTTMLARQEKTLGDKSESDLFQVAGTLSTQADFSDAKIRVDTLLSYSTGDHQARVSTLDLDTGDYFKRTSQFNFSSAELAAQATLQGWAGQAWHLQPHLKAGVDVFLQESARLSTGNEADIIVQAREQSRGYVTLGAQLDRQIMEGIGLQARAAGTQYFGDTETAFVSHFVGAPAGAQGFRTLGDEVEQQVELEASLAFDLPMQFHLTAGGFAELGDLEAQGAKIALTKAF
ncbi:MAG: autotransporter outer membrane beta-barrel domain-containing protein [Hyphomonadaceae bacterium]|nr:autotransporter outer membrane beta-barrel domain-containing protein [Hyphomonadaceae bacterium]